MFFQTKVDHKWRQNVVNEKKAIHRVKALEYVADVSFFSFFLTKFWRHCLSRSRNTLSRTSSSLSSIREQTQTMSTLLLIILVRKRIVTVVTLCTIFAEVEAKQLIWDKPCICALIDHWQQPLTAVELIEFITKFCAVVACRKELFLYGNENGNEITGHRTPRRRDGKLLSQWALTQKKNLIQPVGNARHRKRVSWRHDMI